MENIQQIFHVMFFFKIILEIHFNIKINNFISFKDDKIHILLLNMRQHSISLVNACSFIAKYGSAATKTLQTSICEKAQRQCTLNLLIYIF